MSLKDTTQKFFFFSVVKVVPHHQIYQSPGMKNFPHFIDWMTMMERIADKKYVLENYTNRITCKGLDSLLSRSSPCSKKTKKMDRHKRGIVVDPSLLFIVLEQTGSEVWSPFRGFKFDLTVLSLIWVNYTEG